MTALYEAARVGDSGAHLASVRRPGLAAHLWHGVQHYDRAIRSCLYRLRKREADRMKTRHG